MASWLRSRDGDPMGGKAGVEIVVGEFRGRAASIAASERAPPARHAAMLLSSCIIGPHAWLSPPPTPRTPRSAARRAIRASADAVTVSTFNLWCPEYRRVGDCVDTYVPGPPYCAHGPRVPEAQGSLARGRQYCTHAVRLPAAGPSPSPNPNPNNRWVTRARGSRPSRRCIGRGRSGC